MTPPDEHGFPFNQPEGRQLRGVLAELYDPAAARRLSADAGLRLGTINFREAPVEVWQQVLTSAANSGRLRVLASVIGADEDSRTARPLLEWLTAQEPEAPPPASSMSPGPDAAAPSDAPDEATAGGAASALSVPPLRTFGAHHGWVTGLAFNPDGSLLASAGEDGQVLLSDTAATAATAARPSLAGHVGAVFSVAFNPDGTLLASGGADHTVRLWDVATGQPVRELVGHSDTVCQVAFNRDGSLLASAGADRTIRLWSIPGGRELRVLNGHSSKVSCVAFRPDGMLASADWSEDSLRLWNSTTGESVSVDILRGPDGWVFDLAFSPDGETLAASLRDGSILLWRSDAGIWKRLSGHNGPAKCLAFSSDGTMLASGGGLDHRVHIWSWSSLGC